jgi:hypothetical protein
MDASEMSVKAAISVSEMCEMCSISRSRWYEMVASGVFPKPVQLPSMKRPVYDRNLQEKCLEIRATGIGMNGVPVLFNRKAKKGEQAKQKTQRQPKDQSCDLIVEAILDGVKRLGLTTTPQAVCDAVAVNYPFGVAGVDLGDVVRKVFLHLQSPKK